ncbi:MAG TPA: hypothetical protein VFR55_11560 [Dehalococcoidia bacterium]|nr:hypothetical protein [Dehalococcoidia bacterium]
MEEPIRISFDEFAHRLRAVFDNMAERGGKVLVEKEGLLFRIEPEKDPKTQDIWANYDPRKVRQGLKNSAGALAGVDRDALIRDIHLQRQQDSHGRPA